ncbi:MAG: GNAT family N-acetyltransferase [Acidobacteriota bacterium]|nr:GNAT family N-acetyltransferase [Acidobacteriota bacterium]
MNTSIPEVETARLRLRPFAPDDLRTFGVMQSDPDVMKYIGDGKPRDEEQVIAWVERNTQRWMQHGLGIWAVTLAGPETLLGWCGLGMLDGTDEVEVGYGFDKSYWNLGYASEAARASLRFGFGTFNLERIVAVSIPDNFASQRVMKKLGMKYVRQAFHYNADVAYYAVTRNEFHINDNDSPHALREGR